MIFESLWPLFFLAAIPIIIILYLLKPKGVDYLISSNLLWKKLVKNEQSKTFFEKFVHNILMYLQILIAALLVIALMSPFIKINGNSGGRKILLLDTSASMQHVSKAGKSRLEEAINQACDEIRASENTQYSIVTVNDVNVNLLAIDISDKDSLIKILKDLECSDSGGDISKAQDILDTILGDTAESAADLIVYTDGSGARSFEELRSTADKELHVVGEASSNVANEYTVFTTRDDGYYDVMVSVANYSDVKVSFDVSLYDENKKLIALKSLELAPSENTFCLFEQVDWQGQTLESQISGISFDDGVIDSLTNDNISYSVKNHKNLIKGLLIGDGNVFIEKAYFAVTGESITKAKSDIESDENYNIIIYDSGQNSNSIENNRLIFGDAKAAPDAEVIETLENVVLDMTDCELTAGLSGFTIGVNTAYCFALPEGAKSFLEYKDKCVGYYREQNGIKEVVVGFDIRESDFPLRAEFPVFLANAMIYLSDTSWLATNIYYAGEEIALQPWAELDKLQFESRPAKAGLYQVGNEDYQETYVVRFQTSTESDGRQEADSINNTGEVQLQKVKQALRNFFLILVLVLLVIEWIIYIRQMRYKGKFYLAVRAVVMLCIILALFGIRIQLGSNQIATIFVVDFSNSNEDHIQETENYLQETIAKMPSGNAYGIVTFGKNTLVEQFLTKEKHYGGLMTLPEKSATNFEDAISKALTLIPSDYSGRLVLLTDGKETKGNIYNMAQALISSKAELLTLLYENEEMPDAYIDNVIIPSYLHPGDKYSVNVIVESNYDTDAVVNLYNGSRQIAANSVHLNKGSNRFVFNAQIDADANSGSMESIRAVVQASGDTCLENDSFNAYSVVEAMPRVLVISGGNNNASQFTSVLNAAGCDYSVVSALNAPDNINDMLDYKSIILINTYIDDLPIGFLENLETYVKDYGCGFICCGGSQSFALGGYRGTVLETVLPVDMMLRSMNEIPSMAMVMVIDHSGSMIGMTDTGVSNLDIAIRAAVVAVDNLSASDYVGVLTFDDKYSWQVELTKVNDKTAIKEKIKQISEGGGTTIKPALLEAYNVLLDNDASVKHVVLLTDGMGETTNFQDVIDAYTNSGITLSTVAVGDYSDTQLLKRLANNCGGRYYHSDVSSDIPKIFAQEVFLGGDSYIQNGEIPLVVQKGNELTSNLFADGWPLIYGYIAATPKTASNTIIVSADKDNPILTVWQYGLGRTVAWNSDVTGEWSGAFAGKEDYVQLWRRIVDYSTGNANMGDDNVDVVTVGENTEITYQTNNYSSNTDVFVTVIDPDGVSVEKKLHATAPGKYTIELPTSQTGLYHFNVRRSEGGEIQSYITTAAAVQFSDEYKFNIDASSYLKFIEQYGRRITEDEFIWNKISTGARERYSLTNWLLLIAICLFLADVAMRRFQYEPRFNVGYRKKQKDIQNTTAQSYKNQSQENEHSFVNAEKSEVEKGNANPIEGKKKEAKKTKHSKQVAQTLDTSQLLKKKDDRKI